MDEDCLNASKHLKIEETVLDILQTSDLEITTEFGVRAAAAERLGFSLSGLTYRRFVGQLVNSFLLSAAVTILRTNPLHRNSDGSNNDENAELYERQRQQQLSGSLVGSKGNYDGKIICKLSDKRKVTVHDFNGTTMVSIRDFYIKDGNMLPERGLNSGLSLTPSQWKSFRRSFPSIQEAIVKLESRLRRKYAVHRSGNLNSGSEAIRKQIEAEMKNPLVDSAAEESQTEVGISNLTSIVHHPTKRKQTESEAEMTNLVVESAAEKSQTEAGISNLTSTVHHPTKRKRTEGKAEMTNSVVEAAAKKSQTEAGISNLTSIVHCPTKRKHAQSEAEMTNSVAESSAEKSQTEGSISKLTSIVRPHIKVEQTEPGTSMPVTTSNYPEDMVVERKQEAAGTFGSIATSDSREQIPSEGKQPEAHISTSMPAFPTEGEFCDTVNAVHSQLSSPAERKQTETETSNLVPVDRTRGQRHYTVNSIRTEQLIPIQPARLDGRNYHSWRHQMELFLNQLNIAHVLAESCPSISVNPEASYDENVQVKAAVQRWINDDHMCRHNILNSLCDNLFQMYSHKSYSARELWEELKLAYNEDFGTQRSQISKYINFQMVDGVSILEQVQELHKIADSIIASGSWIDENFHVSVIVSKLPPSWKEFRVRLMHEEFLPLNMLLHHIKVEEESRNSYKTETIFKKGHWIEPKLDYRVGMRQSVKKRVCYNCGKEGHISKNCYDRKFETCVKSNEKENGVLAPNIDTKMVEAENKK